MFHMGKIDAHAHAGTQFTKLDMDENLTKLGGEMVSRSKSNKNVCYSSYINHGPNYANFAARLAKDLRCIP